MGLGGAFAACGGGISIVCLLSFAYLTKLSLDLIVDLSSCPEIIVMVKEYYENEVGYYESEPEEMVEFDEEVAGSGSDGDEYQPPMNDAGEDGKNNSIGSQDQNAEQTTPEDTTKDGDETARITNKKDTSPLMAQEETLEAENHLESNRYDSLTTGSSPNLQLPLLNIDSDGNPISTLQLTEAQPNEELLQPCTYEELGRAAYGSRGRLAVLISKCLYSFGCLVAYVVVVRDNFGPALRRIISSDDSPAWLQDDDYLALWVSTLVMLPLSCPRTMEPLAKFSFLSVVSIMFLALSVVYLYFSCTDPMTSQTTFYENWIEIRSFSGFFESLGTFVFTFVCHHVVNIAYESLPTKLRNPKTWRRVSTNSIVMSTEASLAIGLFAYMTFGANTPADVLLAYPPDITLANISRLLLCLTMVLTFPLPFLTCREMLVLIMVDAHRLYYIHQLTRFNIFARLLGCITILRRKLWTLLFKETNNQSNPQLQLEDENVEPDAVEENVMEMQPPVPVRKRFSNWGKKLWIFNREYDHEWWDPAQPLLSDDEEENPLLDSSIGGLKGEAVNPSPLSSPEPSISSSEESYSDESISVVSVRVPAPKWLLKNGNGRQLSILWHAALTFVLWILATMSAVKAPSLGDVLDLVGACTGTLLAFVLPAVFSFKLKGYTHVSCAILSIGGFVGVCGTISSLVKFIRDTHE
jgi:amino acid permease